MDDVSSSEARPGVRTGPVAVPDHEPVLAMQGLAITYPTRGARSRR